MELNTTQKAIIGFIAARARSGYEIKQLVDNSTRFFWAASYGRIYPELKRLEKAGLIKGADASTGARNRTVYEITAKGQDAAREWISAEPEVFEMRDEGLLKLFFAGALDAGRGPEIARERAEESAAVAAELRALQNHLDDGEHGPEVEPDAGSKAVLQYGIDLNEFVADWFERKARELAASNKTKNKEN